MDSTCTQGANGVWTCALTRPGGYLAHAVWRMNGSTSYTPGSAYTRYRDLDGNMTTIGPTASVTIGMKPLLFESGTVTNGVGVAPLERLALRAIPSVTRGPTRILFGAAPAARRRLTIRDVQGRRVRGFDVAPGAVSLAWDGTDGGGRAVRSGVYFIRLDGPDGTGEARVSIVR